MEWVEGKAGLFALRNQQKSSTTIGSKGFGKPAGKIQAENKTRMNNPD